MTDTLLQSDMCNHLLFAIISWVCLLHTGFCAGNCNHAVIAPRKTFHVAAGESLSLSCEVLHCGLSWTGHWLKANSTAGTATDNAVKESRRHRLTNVTLSADSTRLVLDFLDVDQSDEGSYGCAVTWGGALNEQGHRNYVNVTGAVASPRSVLHRVLVCAAALLCLPIILGVARCLSSKVTRTKRLPGMRPTAQSAVHRDTPSFCRSTDQPQPAPQPLPRCPIPQKHVPVPKKRSKAPPESQPKPEVVYADISQDALRKQGAGRQPAQSTVYSALSFQPAGKTQHI